MLTLEESVSTSLVQTSPLASWAQISTILSMLKKSKLNAIACVDKPDTGSLKPLPAAIYEGIQKGYKVSNNCLYVEKSENICHFF